MPFVCAGMCLCPAGNADGRHRQKTPCSTNEACSCPGTTMQGLNSSPGLRQWNTGYRSLLQLLVKKKMRSKVFFSLFWQKDDFFQPTDFLTQFFVKCAQAHILGKCVQKGAPFPRVEERPLRTTCEFMNMCRQVDTLYGHLMIAHGQADVSPGLPCRWPRQRGASRPGW